jgi:hypothetical protein
MEDDDGEDDDFDAHAPFLEDDDDEGFHPRGGHHGNKLVIHDIQGNDEDGLGIEEDDEEKLFFQQSLELHYNISEVINILFQTHTISYYPVYYREFHEMMRNFTHIYCTKEDKRFAFLILSDVIEFGLPTNHHVMLEHGADPAAAAAANLAATIANTPNAKQMLAVTQNFLEEVVPILHNYCLAINNISNNNSQEVEVTSSSRGKKKGASKKSKKFAITTGTERVPVGNEEENEVDFEVLRTIVYILGIIYEIHSSSQYGYLEKYIKDSLLALHSLMTFILTLESQKLAGGAAAADLYDEEVVGPCKDNVISAIGLICQQRIIYNIGQSIISDKQVEFLVGQWLQFLPLRFDEVSCVYQSLI